MQRKYGSGIGAVQQIVKQEGFYGLFTGVSCSVGRAAMLTSAMMFAYDGNVEFWARVIGAIPGIKLISTIFASAFACIFATPFDNVKTKYQRMTPQGPVHYKSVHHAFSRTMATESFMGLYTGFWINFAKTVPTALMTMSIIERTKPYFLS